MAKAAPSPKPPPKTSGLGVGPGGGPTAIGGYNFQAAVTAISLVYLARGVPLPWLNSLSALRLREVAGETGRAGDDLRLTLEDGSVVEVQVKKGLRGQAKALEALAPLARAVANDEAAFALLVVCPRSSRTVAEGAARDLRRLGDDPNAAVGPLVTELRDQLQLPPALMQAVGRRVRLVTVSALDDAGDAIAAARAELGHICARPSQIQAAWDSLYREAAAFMAARGRRRISDVSRGLTAAGIGLSRDLERGIAWQLERLRVWTLETHGAFNILGVTRQLPIGRAWRNLNLEPLAPSDPATDDLAKVLDTYHRPAERYGEARNAFSDATALARFFPHAVVVAGPGLGKSTLLRRLAYDFADEGRPVLRVSAREVAAAMRAGKPFETALFELGLDGSNLPAAMLQVAPIDDWVFLCDGLDEAGPDHDGVAEKLVALKAGRPGSRIVVTTRPIGYQTGRLASWRHYGIAPLDPSTIERDLFDLLDHLGVKTGDLRLSEEAEAGILKDQALRGVVARSLLMLGLAAALIARGKPVGPTRTELFREIFRMIQDEPPPRAGAAPEAPELLDAVFDRFGWEVLDDPLADEAVLVRRIVEALSPELGEPVLKVAGRVRACLAYWEALGLIETLRHGPRTLLTATHQMLAEYGAGRALAALAEPRRSQAVSTHLAAPRWAEALSFAAAEGAADAVLAASVDQGFAGRDGQNRLMTALEILGVVRGPVRPDLVCAVFDAAASVMSADDVGRAAQIGLKIVHAARPWPHEAHRLTPGLLNAGFPWSRLCAWTLSVTAVPDSIEPLAALSALEDALDAAEERARLSNGIVLQDPERELLRLLGEAVIAGLLLSLPIAEADLIIERLVRRQGLSNYATWKRIAPLLNAAGSRVNPFKEFARNWRGLDFKGFDQAMAFAFSQISEALMIDPTAPVPVPEPRRPLFQIGAVYKASDWDQMDPSDVWAWPKPGFERAVRAVFQAIITVWDLDPEAVDREARQLRVDLEQQTEEAFSTIFSDLPKVDLPKLDTLTIDRVALDVDGLKAALLDHPAAMVVAAAATFLDAILEPAERQALVETALNRKREVQVQAGVILAEQLPVKVRRDLLVANVVPGAPALAARLHGLGRIDPADRALALKTLRPILLGDDSGDAVAAARLAPGMSLAPTDLALIREAEYHWRSWEANQGNGPRSITPRSILIEILDTQDALDLDELLTLGVTVGGLSLIQKPLGRRLNQSGGVRAEFARRCSAGAVSVPILDAAFRAGVPFTDADLETLGSLVESRDAKVRLACVALFDKGAFCLDAKRAHLSKLRGDVEPSIRTAAARALERL